MKTCTKCGKEKPAAEFHKNKSRKDGLSDWCGECKRTYQIQYEQKTGYQKQYEKSPSGVFTKYKNAAKRRNLEFTLTLEQLEDLISQPCHYCGEYTQGKEFCGIDRVDNDVGYVLINCVPCCYSCNSMKGKKTLKEFSDCIKRIYNHLLDDV